MEITWKKIFVLFPVIAFGVLPCRCEESDTFRKAIERVLYGYDLGADRYMEFQKLGEEGFTAVLGRLEKAEERSELEGALVLILWGLRHEMPSVPLRTKTIGILQEKIKILDNATKGQVFAASAGIRDKVWLDRVQEYLISEDESIRLSVLAALSASNEKLRAASIREALSKRRKSLTSKEVRLDKTLLEGEKAIKILEQSK